jgi:O-methyltransferase involved in polyketide biosynthesis
VTYVTADLEVDSFEGALRSGGVGIPTDRCVVGMLGVSYYLSIESFGETIRSIGEICPPGSTLVLDYMDPAVIDGTTRFRGARRAARSVRRRGEPYTLGLTQKVIESIAADAGFRMTGAVRVTDLVDRYGGERPYCRADDYMGVVRLTRVGNQT